MDVVFMQSFIDFITAFLSLTSASIFYIAYKLIYAFDLHPPCFALGAPKFCTGHSRLNLAGHHYRNHEHKLHKKTLGKKKFAVYSLDCSIFPSNRASTADGFDHRKTELTQLKVYPQEFVDQRAVPDDEKSRDLSPIGELCGDHRSLNGYQISLFKHLHGSVHASCELGSSIGQLPHSPLESEKENERVLDMIAELSCDSDNDNILEVGCFDDIEKLKEELASHRQILDRTYEELEKQRTLSASAAGQAMATISKLQKEKAEIQMEAMQYLRMVKEKEAFDEKAIIDLRDTLVKLEAEVLALEKEMEICRRSIVIENSESAEQRHESNSFQDNIVFLKHSFCEQGIQMGCLEHQYKPLEISQTYISEEMLHGERHPHSVFQNSFPKVPINDFRTASMVQRDNSRLLLKEEVCSLESKLNMLETDRELLKDTIKLKNGHEQVLSLSELEISPTNTRMHGV